MSVYYVHSMKAVDDLLEKKTEHLPIVVFETTEDAKLFPELIAIERVKTFGIVQTSSDDVPIFSIGNVSFILENDLPEHAMKMPVAIFPELVGNYETTVQLEDGGVKKVKFVNETLNLSQLFEHYYKVFKQTLLDSVGIDLEGVEICLDTDKIYGDGELAVSHFIVNKEKFVSLMQGIPKTKNGALTLMLTTPAPVSSQ